MVATVWLVREAPVRGCRRDDEDDLTEVEKMLEMFSR
jgi:hypothetical protein